MTTVYKYVLPIDDTFSCDMPSGAEILHVQAQSNIPCMWARVDPDAPTITRRFRLAGTGHQLGDGDFNHLGTIFIHDGALVFHLFEVTSKKA